MEVNKLTIFLFVILVVIMAFSTFIIFDAVGGFSALRESFSSAGATISFENDITDQNELSDAETDLNKENSE